MAKHWSALGTLESYVTDLLKPEDEALKNARLKAENEKLPLIQVNPIDARHLEVIARACQAQKIIEIGTLFGYSALALAKALPPSGRLHTFESDSRHAKLAQDNFNHSHLNSLITLHVGSALLELPKIEKEGPFDLVFIDADKNNYCHYLEWSAHHLRKGGVLLADNTLAWNQINRWLPSLDESPDEWRSISSLKKFNEQLSHDPRFCVTLLPTGEGLSFAVRI